MVWAAVTADGRSPLVFLDRCVKVNAARSPRNCTEGLVEAMGSKTFRAETMDVPAGLSAVAKSSRESRVAKKKCSTLHYGPDLSAPPMSAAEAVGFGSVRQ